ncbi:MAG: pseudouridine synthase [Candidatus Saccharibacteria bacterium]|nr:pseudouridine synthase [Candidatus Saccharibacteria bacterium]
MRLNKYIAQATGLSRRAADAAIAEGRVVINDHSVRMGQAVESGDIVKLDGMPLSLHLETQTIMLNKPAGYICSRDGQGGKTIYDLLPPELHHLKPVGRLDKYSSGLLLLTNDGQLAQELAHPKYQKQKTYEVRVAKPLQPLHRQMIQDNGIMLDDGVSKFALERIKDGNDNEWKVVMREGRNRQIRRTFDALGYSVTRLHRTHFGTYSLGGLRGATYTPVA